jgi:hypothetical protein
MLSLQDKIEQAFAGVPRPDDDSITTCDCCDCLEVRERFRGKERHSLDTDFLASNTELPLLSPQALHYFLPAYLLHCLTSPNVDPDVYYSVLSTLCPGKEDETSSAYYQDLLRVFLQEQMAVLFEYLDWAYEDTYSWRTKIERGKKRLKKYYELAHAS